jgi:beta-glucosidase
MVRLWLAAFAALFIGLAISCSTDNNDPQSSVNPVPRNTWWLERHEQINQRVAQGKIDLIFVGDSITQGWEESGKRVWQKFYGHRNAANLGIGGDRTQHVLWRLENGNIDGIQPKLAVVMIGTNNSLDNTPEEIFAGNRAIVNKLRHALPDTNILLLAIFPLGQDGNNKLRQVTEKANALIAKLADGKKIYFLDIGDKFLQDDGTLTREVMPDLLHPSEKGYEIWAGSIEPSVKKLLGES